MGEVIKQLLAVGGAGLAVFLGLGSVALLVIKGIFSFHRSRSADRKDFLGMFTDLENREGLWLSISIRHCFGSYLPPKVIKELMLTAEPARALLEVSNSWGAFAYDEETSEVRWRNPKNASASLRKRMLRRWLLGYIVLGLVAAVLAYIALKFELSQVWRLTVCLYAILFLLAAGMCLVISDRMRDAGLASERWLKLKNVE